ncbi:MAG TPA: hypothetical protein DEP66_04150 [Acidimicrobiaceae bacterium]|nr:hypothetical protein [Acidimicrobiaceae bacterium]HCB37395.1 hypothetical protein [Acidimicrobiaceae bacterium]
MPNGPRPRWGTWWRRTGRHSTEAPRERRPVRAVRGGTLHALVLRGRGLLGRRLRGVRHADGRLGPARHRPAGRRGRPHARPSGRGRRGALRPRRGPDRHGDASDSRPLPRPRPRHRLEHPTLERATQPLHRRRVRARLRARPRRPRRPEPDHAVIRTTAVARAAPTLLAALAFLSTACGGESGPAQPDVPLTLPPSPISAEVLALGRAVHNGTCAVCHGRNGEGGIGPALTGVAARLTTADHLSVVQFGRGEMQAFRNLIDPAEIIAVVAYQRSRFE